MKKADAETTLQELKDLVVKFRDERDWAKYHTPKNLSMSIAIEAAELMEIFQWDGYDPNDNSRVREELADVIIYCLNIADTLDIDVSDAVVAKLNINAKKYPLELFNADRDFHADHRNLKQKSKTKRK